jgi:hypothetical protein
MPPMGAAFLPKPDDSWPKWLVVVYYIVMAVICLGMIAVMVIKTFKFIKKGHAGIKVRRGQPIIRDGGYVYVGPGIHPMIPFLDSIEDISIQDVTTDLPMLLAETIKDKLKVQHVIDAAPTWGVINTPDGVHDAIFIPKNLEETVSSKLRKSLNRAVVSAENPSDVVAVEAAALVLCNAELVSYGVLAKDMGLISVARVSVQVLGELLNPDGAPVTENVAQLGGVVAGGLGLIQGGQTSS